MTHPEHGYYRHGLPIGRCGDFITAPEISQVFGELIGLWAVAVWEEMRCPRQLTLVELGPGRGVLIVDALRAIRQTRPHALAAFRLHLVEVSTSLREFQRQALIDGPLPQTPVWQDRLEAVPSGPVVLIANEFIDTLPIRQYVRTEGVWRERRIGLDEAGNGFAWTLGAPRQLTLPENLIDCEDGDVVELCPAADALSAEIGRRVACDGGAALLIDYGHARPSFGETLQAVRDHAYADPLADPGTADLSHQVDFAALATAAAAAGAATYRPVPQGLFLSRLGIAARAQALAAASPAKAGSIEGAVRRLVHPGRMGVLFKALAIADPALPPPPGFTR
ncbi:MAG: class I SAM-dependent methyltransferase [Rhodospirillales bacterium]|nr:class I SAM-dependent methyltransferase [Rhodospirillales bacterium]